MRSLGRSTLAAVVTCVVSIAVACSSSRELSAGDYDASCAVDSDCVLVTFGDVCAVACNPNGAINQRDHAKLESDRKDKSQDCDEVMYVRDPCEGQARPHAARCTSGRCTAVESSPPPADAGADG